MLEEPAEFDSTITIRSASLEDKDFIISLIPRLVEFNPPVWRNAEKMTEVDKKNLIAKLLNQPEGTAILLRRMLTGFGSVLFTCKREAIITTTKSTVISLMLSSHGKEKVEVSGGC